MSNEDPTPLTPITIGDRLLFLERALKGGDDATLLALQNTLLLLRGARQESLTTLADALFTQGTTRSPLLLSVDGRLADIQQRLDRIQAAVGAVPYEDLELASVRGLLSALLTAQTLRGVPPPRIPSDIPSTGTLPGDGRRFILWPDIPNVIESTPPITLTPQNGWAGYFVYIQSDAPAYRIGNPPLYEGPTNSWDDLEAFGTTSLTFSVASNYDARGFMRVPTQLSYYEWSASEQTLTNTQFGNRYQPNYSKYPSLSQTVDQFNFRRLNGNWFDWWIVNDGSEPYTIQWENQNDGLEVYSREVRVTRNTVSITIQSLGAAGRVQLFAPGTYTPIG